ncbi:MAG: ABC transporter substrate-binding protein [Thermodesulfobacteriota bacterium]
MRKLMVLAVLVLAGMLAAPAAVSAQDVIKLGIATPLSAPGDYKSGQIQVQTTELAVEELNAKGGLLGKKVVLVKADDEGKPAVGVTAVQRLIANEKVSAIVGPWHSSVAMAQAKVVNESGVPMMMNYTWADDLTGKNSPYVWRVGPYNSEIAALLVPYIQKSGFKTMAIMHETTAFGTPFAESLMKLAESKGIKVYKTAYPAEAADLKPQLLELKSKTPQPELLVIAAVYQAMNLIPKQAHEIGLAPKMSLLACWDWPTYPDFWEVMGDKGVGMTYATFESKKLKLSPLGESFKKAFKAKHNFEPPVFGFFLYDGIMIIAEAVKKANSADPKKINEALAQTKFAGTTGEIVFERKDGPVWNQWTGHQLFVKKLTAVKQKGEDADVIYP